MARLTRALRFWRIAAIVALVACVAAIAARFENLPRNSVGLLEVHGIIFDDS